MKLADGHIWFVQTIPQGGCVDIADVDSTVLEHVPEDLARHIVREHNKAVFKMESRAKNLCEAVHG